MGNKEYKRLNREVETLKGFVDMIDNISLKEEILNHIREMEKTFLEYGWR